MTLQKIYLEPRKDFDACIISETDEFCTYSVQEMLAILAEQFGSTEPSMEEEDLLFMALEWFEYNIEPLQHHYAIKFDFIAYE